MYKPAGHNSLSPYLIVDDAAAALAFIRAVFQAEPTFIDRDETGDMVHAEVRIDDTVLMIGQMPGGPEAHLHVYVPDADEAFEKARAAGGVVVQEVMEKGDGDRRGGIADPTGTVWWLSTQIAARS